MKALVISIVVLLAICVILCSWLVLSDAEWFANLLEKICGDKEKKNKKGGKNARTKKS